ncbi:hypothetical protein OEZ85_004574 [Tetradesmus obliquus]|uniref:Uncharacterized protein n=1 Tax=Tetradesmus obliquus TaxID=3088 RepID=A0ABY8UML7_TETOB|nr:hypothetical protein OEZ85_004574 [Tetradesmus obliquus]
MNCCASTLQLGRQSGLQGIPCQPHRRLCESHLQPKYSAVNLSAQLQSKAVQHSTHPDMAMDASLQDSCGSAPVKVTARDNFAAACTLLGGFDTSCFRGYVGTWTSFDMQHNNCGSTGSSATVDADAAGTAAAAAAARVTPVFVDETVNFRLFRMEDPAAMQYHHVNMYQGGGRPAAASYKTYLTADAAPGRADGYGLREWRHDPSGALWSPDASGWRSSSGTAAAEKTLLGLAVADASLALINGALPSSFDAQHSPGSWWMEAIFKQQGSHARRWGMLHRFDAGRIANTKSMNEDLTEIPTEQLHSCSIDPASIAWQPRRQGSFDDIDSLFATQQQQQQRQQQQPSFNRQGTATTFTYDEQQQLTRSTGPCTWSSQHVVAMNAAARKQQQQQQLVVQLDLPDWGYSRLPADISLLTAAAAATADSTSSSSSSSSSGAAVVFELGTVLSNGSLARWLLQYDAAGGRLLQRATYELYPAADAAA